MSGDLIDRIFFSPSSDPRVRKIFTEFLEDRHVSEVASFFSAVSAYKSGGAKKSDSNSKIGAQKFTASAAEKIFTRFIEPHDDGSLNFDDMKGNEDTHYETLNLSSISVEQCREKLKRGELETAFDDIVEEMKKLLAANGMIHEFQKIESKANAAVAQRYATAFAGMLVILTLVIVAYVLLTNK